MASNRTDYVTIALDGQGARDASAVAVSVEGREPRAQVIYRLSSVAAPGSGSVLIVGFGNAAKAVARACKKAGADAVFATATADKRKAFTYGGIAEPCVIGEAFDERLFSNECCLESALAESGAKTVLFAHRDACVSPLARAIMHKAGALALTPFSNDKSLEIWVRVEFDPTAALDRDPAWSACPVCGLSHDRALVMEAGGVCPTCQGLYRLDSDERIAQVFDEGTFEEWFDGIEERNPLDFPGYESTLERARTRSGRSEAVRCGKALLAGMPVALAVMEPSFMMGSMGSVVGEKITRTVERATDDRLPAVIFTASGGARMQEGLASLMQMAKVSAAIERHGRTGLLYVSVLTDPTTGGVTASFAMEGDIILAEPHALIGFAGRRVIQDTIRKDLPEGFQTAEFALAHGLIDAIVPRASLRRRLAHILAIHASRPRACDAASDGGKPAAAPCADGSRQAPTFESVEAALCGTPVQREREALDDAQGRSTGLMGRIRGIFDGIAGGANDVQRALRRQGLADAPDVKPVEGGHTGGKAWESVQLARNIHRPTSLFYIASMVRGFVELHGDRAFGDDGAIVGGIGWIGGRAVTIIGQEKGSDLTQRIARNFGCPQPEGYRKALRLMKQAEKFGRPVVCLVDTQGAYCGAESEERGQGNAIADNLVSQAGLRVPIVSVVVGEGGSGGALALAMGNRVAMQEHAVYSVLSPEGFASILWKDRSRAAEAAAVMRMSAEEARDLGVADEVLSEGPAPAHENPKDAARGVTAFVERALEDLSDLSADELVTQRYGRYRAF